MFLVGHLTFGLPGSRVLDGFDDSWGCLCLLGGLRFRQGSGLGIGVIAGSLEAWGLRTVGLVGFQGLRVYIKLQRTPDCCGSTDCEHLTASPSPPLEAM